MKKLLPLLFCVLSTNAFTQTELIDFEGSPQNVTIDSLTGCWQIGTPSKTLFDTAYSASHALMTDTINDYPDGTVSYAYFTFPTGNMASSYSLSFMHRYDTESGADGGYVEYFDCTSSTWMNVVGNPGIVCPAYFLTYTTGNPFMTLYNSETGFGGTNTGWDYSYITFGCAALAEMGGERGMGDARLRFVFVSDGNSTSQEGWMIDDIQWVDFGGICAGIDEFENNLLISVYPSQTSGTLNFDSESDFFTRITIYDFSGKQIEDFSFDRTTFKTLELSHLANGLYFYSVDEGKATGKLVVEK